MLKQPSVRKSIFGSLKCSHRGMSKKCRKSNGKGAAICADSPPYGTDRHAIRVLLRLLGQKRATAYALPRTLVYYSRGCNPRCERRGSHATVFACGA